MDANKILEKQRKYFQSGATLPVKFRLEMLDKLKSAVKKYDSEITAALKEDLGKSSYESFMSETGPVTCELNFMLRHTRQFASRRYVHTPLQQFASISYRKPSPLGNVLIISPWNYPFLLSIDPLVDAIAAGNTAIIKPSAYSPATSRIIEKIISECFPEKYIAVVHGGREENANLLDMKFDMIFFTGSQNTGKEVLRHTAETLTPTVLELGGKSPCIVDSTAKLKLAARRIVFGKFLNCGQTCVAPDYILCERSVKDDFVKELKAQIKKQYGENPFGNPDYGKIINKKHFDRILGLIDDNKIVIGGNANEETLQIAPTVLDNVTWSDKIMQEEIFGPVLPVLTFDKFEDIFTVLANKQKPLALYIFSESRRNIRETTERCAYGGGCVNDTITHLATSKLGFGGVGESGMGAYHGKDGFDVFSHTKGIMDKMTWLDIPVRYQPYTSGFGKLLMHIFVR